METNDAGRPPAATAPSAAAAGRVTDGRATALTACTLVISSAQQRHLHSCIGSNIKAVEPRHGIDHNLLILRITLLQGAITQLNSSDPAHHIITLFHQNWQAYDKVLDSYHP